jgi:hypothetical protein
MRSLNLISTITSGLGTASCIRLTPKVLLLGHDQFFWGRWMAVGVDRPKRPIATAAARSRARPSLLHLAGDGAAAPLPLICRVAGR